MLVDVHGEFLPTSGKYAEETLRRLSNCENDFFKEFEKLFYPQPDLRSYVQDGTQVKSVSTAISIASNCSKGSPDLVVRREIFAKRELESMKGTMSAVLQHLMAIAQAENDRSVTKRVLDAAESFMDTSFYNQPHNWQSTMETMRATILLSLYRCTQRLMMLSTYQCANKYSPIPANENNEVSGTPIHRDENYERMSTTQFLAETDDRYAARVTNLQGRSLGFSCMVTSYREEVC